MTNAIFITVRTGSTRLPNKALKLIDGIPTIEYVIKRIKYSETADKIVLCTTNLQQDDVLVDIAQRNQIDFFRGSEEDKLERWHGAAKKYNVDFIVTGDGDDLFCEPKLMDLAFDQFQRKSPDFIQATGIICGAFTYGIKVSALDRVCHIKDSTNTEMMWGYFINTGLFIVDELENAPLGYYRDDIRMTLDYEEDFTFFNEVIKKVKSNDSGYITLDMILKVIEENPEIKDINFFRQKEFLDNQKRKTNIKIKGGQNV